MSRVDRHRQYQGPNTRHVQYTSTSVTCAFLTTTSSFDNNNTNNNNNDNNNNNNNINNFFFFFFLIIISISIAPYPRAHGALQRNSNI